MDYELQSNLTKIFFYEKFDDLDNILNPSVNKV